MFNFTLSKLYLAVQNINVPSKFLDKFTHHIAM